MKLGAIPWDTLMCGEREPRRRRAMHCGAIPDNNSPSDSHLQAIGNFTVLLLADGG